MPPQSITLSSRHPWDFVNFPAWLGGYGRFLNDPKPTALPPGKRIEAPRTRLAMIGFSASTDCDCISGPPRKTAAVLSATWTSYSYPHIHWQTVKYKISTTSAATAVGYPTHMGAAPGPLRGATGNTPWAPVACSTARGGWRQRKCSNCNRLCHDTALSTPPTNPGPDCGNRRQEASSTGTLGGVLPDVKRAGAYSARI